MKHAKTKPQAAYQSQLLKDNQILTSVLYYTIPHTIFRRGRMNVTSLTTEVKCEKQAKKLCPGMTDKTNMLSVFDKVRQIKYCMIIGYSLH